MRFVALMADVTIEDRMRRRLAALDALLLAARTPPSDASAARRAAACVAAALVPMLAEVAGATVRIGDSTTAVAGPDLAVTRPTSVGLAGLGTIDLDVHVDAGRLFDDAGVHELAHHAAWLFGTGG